MPRWLWWTPVGALILGFALIGLRWGWIAATITETDVINRYAAQYVETQGGALSDCVAYPGLGDVWLVVRCARGQDAVYAYHVNRLGRLVPGPDALTGPEA